jgi:hypothetical protein
MKTQRTTRYLAMAMIVSAFAVATWSCNKDDDPSLADLRDDKLQYLEDSLRISDSLKRINAAGIVNYAITIVNASTSSFHVGSGVGRSKASQSIVNGAIVTISQFGKVSKDTTDESGMVVFNGFFRSAVNVTIEAEGFTSASYISAVSLGDSTRNGSISFIGNIIPLFETAGANTATITGRATIQTNLTNKTRELAPDGTAVTASIDATDSWFAERFMTDEVVNLYEPACGCDILYVGEILQATYSTGVVGTVTGGNYSITVPAAIDELPTWIDYSDVAADQTLFNSTAVAGDRTETYRTIFGLDISPSAIPSGSTVTIAFNSGSGATATAVVSPTNGLIDRINVTNGGTGYAGVPLVRITDATGTGATATATVVNGVVTGITLTSPGSGYTAPSVTLVAGTLATGTVATLGDDGTVTSIVINNSGSGYTTAPTVTIDPPTGLGLVTNVPATATAVITNGRVTAITITNAGMGYSTNPIVTLSAPSSPTGTPASASAFYSGESVQDVQVTNPGGNYTFAPRVTFAAPNITTGRRATGVANFNAATGQVTGITITDAGIGYTALPAVTLASFTNAAAAEIFLGGGSVVSADIVSQGSGYTGTPTLTFTGGGGQGATGTAVVVDGKVVGINITNGGTGYNTGTPPTITFDSGNGAVAFATVTNGAITSITVTDPGRFYVGTPLVTITSAQGGGATATATVANGGVSTVTVVAQGSGYLEGNTPAGSGQFFNATYGTYIYTRPGKTYINDIYYGTGERQDN